VAKSNLVFLDFGFWSKWEAFANSIKTQKIPGQVITEMDETNNNNGFNWMKIPQCNAALGTICSCYSIQTFTHDN
jgi:hypothetical protein